MLSTNVSNGFLMHLNCFPLMLFKIIRTDLQKHFKCFPEAFRVFSRSIVNAFHKHCQFFPEALSILSSSIPNVFQKHCGIFTEEMRRLSRCIILCAFLKHCKCFIETLRNLFQQHFKYFPEALRMSSRSNPNVFQNIPNAF